MHDWQLLHIVFLITLYNFHPIVPLFINRILDDINVFELGLIKMKHNNVVRGKPVIGQLIPFRQKMRHIVLNRQIKIIIVHILEQRLIRIFTFALYNVLEPRQIRVEQAPAGINQHNPAIEPPHLLAFVEHLSRIISNPVVVFEISVAHQIRERRRRSEPKDRIDVSHNNHIRLDDTHLVVFIEGICENEITRSQSVKVGVSAFEGDVIRDAAVIIGNNTGDERPDSLYECRRGIIDRIQIHNVVARILAQHFEEIELEF